MKKETIMIKNNSNKLLHCIKYFPLIVNLMNKNKEANKHVINDSLLEVIDIISNVELKVIR